MKLSLSWKVNAIIVMVVALVLLGAGGYEISQTWQQLVRNLEDTSTAIIKRLTVTLVNPMWAFNDDDILTFMQGEMQNEHVLAIEVKRPVGQNNYFIMTRDATWQVVSQQEVAGDITGFVVKESNIERAGDVLGTVTVYMTDRFINETYRTEVVTLLIRTLILLLFIVLTLFVFIERVVVRPVRTLTRQAQLIAGGNLDEAVVTQREDELGILADSFEVMRQSIKEKITALHGEIVERQRAENTVRELNEELEQKVIIRTSELTKVNHKLEEQNVELESQTQELERQSVRLLEAKKEAEQARARADLANQAKSDFLSRMSHELRTPLNGILGYAQILKNDRDLSRKQADGVAVIQQSGEHLLTLITDILDLAKIEAGKFELLPTPIQLENFMNNTLAIIQMRAEKKRLEIGYQALSMIPDAVAVDEKRLRQILLNLLNNAIKFTELGRVTLQLEMIDQPSVNEVRLGFAVIDTGIGMTPEQVLQIFNPFEQVGDVKKRAEGTGLGLAISKQLVEAMGGQLQVESEFNQGSRFWFELLVPLANMTLTQVPISQERITGYEGTRRKILVVDDKGNNRMVFLNILEPLGFEIQMAEDGQQAIDQAQSWQPDLILMDMIMPNVTGFEATQRIRNMSALKTIAIIGTSASAFDKEADQSKLTGCDAFVSKPVHVEELVLLIGELLHLQWQYQEAAVVSASAMDGRNVDLICPPFELLQGWLTLARQGDLLTIEDEADSLLKDTPRYAPFVEKIQDYVLAMNVNELKRFLAAQLEDDKS